MAAELASKQERRLGRYLLKQPLGSGGTGQVYLAWKENATEETLPCVVKFPLQRYATEEIGRRIFLHEACLLIRLGPHPNIVHLVDVEEYHGMPFIVMEYVDGIDLDVLLKRLRDRKQRLALPSIYSIFTGVASGLHHAHFEATRSGEAVSIVHRDIKPSNILVTRKGFVKLADFGIGVALDDGTSGSHMRGTTRYMSPEHLDCFVCPEMDVYSLGVVVWEMIEGKVFREGLEKAQILHAIMEGKVPPIRNPDCPAQLATLIRACLHPDRRQRPSAAEILLALQRCPGYTLNPSYLARELSNILGTAPSSGATDRHFAATPDLVATMAVLELSTESEAANTSVVVEASNGETRYRTDVEIDSHGREVDAPRKPRPRQENAHLPAQPERLEKTAPSRAALRRSVTSVPPSEDVVPVAVAAHHSSELPTPAGESSHQEASTPPAGPVDTSGVTTKFRRKNGGRSSRASTLTLLAVSILSSLLASVATACLLDGMNGPQPSRPVSGRSR